MADVLHIEIIAPTETVYSGSAELVELPGSLGPFEILDGHAALVSTLTSGKIRIKSANGSEKSFEIRNGVARVEKNVITVCAE